MTIPRHALVAIALKVLFFKRWLCQAKTVARLNLTLSPKSICGNWCNRLYTFQYGHVVFQVKMLTPAVIHSLLLNTYPYYPSVAHKRQDFKCFSSYYYLYTLGTS